MFLIVPGSLHYSVKKNNSILGRWRQWPKFQFFVNPQMQRKKASWKGWQSEKSRHSRRGSQDQIYWLVRGDFCKVWTLKTFDAKK